MSRYHRPDFRTYRDECRFANLVTPRWGAYSAPAWMPFSDSHYVPEETVDVRPGMSAVSLTTTPKGDPFGVVALDVACQVRPVRTAAEKAKVAARKKAVDARRRGALDRKPCEVCGAETTEAHHDDYSRLLDVRWLCRKHHDLLHHPKEAAA